VDGVLAGEHGAEQREVILAKGLRCNYMSGVPPSV
jgi:hypothetical protein